MSLRNHRHPFRTAALVLLTAALAACVDQPTVPDQDAVSPTPPGAFDGPSFALSGPCVILPETSTFYDNNTFAPLNDLGRILHDADNPNCAANAATTLYQKLVATKDADYDWFGDGWIDGNYVAMVLAAADRIGSYGHMTPELDGMLQWVASTFKEVGEPGGCGLTRTDNCLDGFSAAAAGYAWVAAYRYRHNDPSGAAAARGKAEALIDSSFNSVCIRRHATGYGPPCDGDAQALADGLAYTYAWNEGPQNPAYGFGLMTSISAAVLGWERSGNLGAYQFSPTQKTVAKGLFEEARRLVAPSSPALNRWPACKVPKDTLSGIVIRQDITVNCGRVSSTSGYEPNMYALMNFYVARLDYAPAGDGYQSNAFDPGEFDLSSSAGARTGWFGYGRYVFYGELGNDWWQRARRPMPLDAYEARGFLERIDGGRVAHGWACDPDASSKAVKLELRVAGTTVMGLANQPSESAVNTQCGGGSAHRFSIQLPAGTVGHTVTARALDYTYGYTDLACAQAGACAVPAAPTVQVVWVRPSEDSWGPPNTHTAAGTANGGSGGVKLEWRDVTFNSNAAWNVVAYEPAPDANGGWSNTIPSAYRCHTFQVRATYFGVTTPIFTYYGRTSAYCSQTARIIWIQPSSTAGYGPPGGLVVAGEAKGAPAGTTVTMYYRNVTLGGSFIKKSFAATPDANGIWLNDIPNVNPYHQYEVYATFDVTTTARCTYAGTNGMTSC